MRKESNFVEKELNTMILTSPDEPRQKLRDVITSRKIKRLRIGRKCIGSRMEWVGNEKIEVPQYKETRFVVDFEDGLSLNVSRPIFLYLKGHHKIEYFGFYD